jgi:hypothetical protein
MTATFAVNFCDNEGYVIDNGVFVFCNDDIILKFVNSDELKAFGERCIKMSEEIYETYKY